MYRLSLFWIRAAGTLGLAATASVGAYDGWAGFFPGIAWALSLVVFLSFFPLNPRWRPTVINCGIGLMILVPALVRLLTASTHRVHDDEFIVGYFSWFQGLDFPCFFAPVPLDPGDWVSQFPRPFFLLQHTWLAIFGIGPWSLKLSVLPYWVVTSFFLYLIVRDLWGVRAALLALGCHAMLAFSVYLETLAINIHGSTAIYVAFIYFAIRYLRHPSAAPAAWCGVSAGCGFLFYPGSFITLPILLLVLGTTAFRARWTTVIPSAGLALLGFVLTLAPYGMYTADHPNYFLNRIQHQGLLNGEASSGRVALEQGATFLQVITPNVVQGLQSLYLDDKGGDGGFNFGHLALFTPLTLCWTLAGAVAALFWLKRRPEILLIYLTFFAAFFILMGLSFPPGAYHRLCIALPFVSIFLMLPLEIICRIRQIPGALRAALVALALVILAWTNQQQYERAVARDNPNGDVPLCELINREFPRRHLYVAAFPSYSFQKSYFFSANKSASSVWTEYHRGILANYNRNEPYVIVIHSPYEIGLRETIWEKVFADSDPAGKIIPFSAEYSLMVNQPGGNP